MWIIILADACKVISGEISLVLSGWIFQAPLGVLEKLQRTEKRNGKQTHDTYIFLISSKERI